MSSMYNRCLMQKTVAAVAGVFFFTGSLRGQPPSNDECSGAIFIHTSSAPGDNTGATQSLPVINCEGDISSVANDVWYYLVPAASGMVNIEVDEAFDAVWEAFSGTCGNLVSLDCADQNPPLAFMATAGETYYLRVYGYDGDEAPFTILTSGVPLPVTLGKLAAAINEKGRAVLSWSTSAEQNNKGFTIQRSADGHNFRATGWQDSKAPGGNSMEQLAYVYEDNDRTSETVFYRLLQTDINGKMEYSNIVMLENFQSGILSVQASPNPVTKNLAVRIWGKQDAGTVLTITDTGGQNAVRLPVTAPEMNIDMSSYPVGIYLLQYRNANTVQTIKINKTN